jgi:hypothetical protein
MPALRARAGFAKPNPARTWVRVQRDDKTLPLTWARPVRLEGELARLVPSQGSGDVPAMGRGEGFVLQSPDDRSIWMRYQPY